ncbi:MAG: LacI family DNA-binding transcriptional regulator [Anaerolineaceae bacterium]|jgi:LacI family transcriptional regulator
MAVTIKDIAKAAGVSHATVSRALHNHPAISKGMVAAIQTLAAEMGYIPSAAARSLKTHQSHALGVIVSNLDDPFWSEVLHSIDEVAHVADYNLFIVTTHRDKQRENEVVQAMVQRGVDGVIICAPQFSPKQSHLLMTYGLPMVIVNNEGSTDSPYLVYNDDVYGIRLATRHLIELGHREIAFLGNSVGGRTSVAREKGFRQEMRTSGVAINEAFILRSQLETLQAGFEAANVLLSQAHRPTAIVCYNDSLAIGVYSAIYQAGLRIPEDISITGFDDIAVAAYLHPPLTTVRQFKARLGAVATTMMLNLLKPDGEPGANKEPQKVLLQSELVVRASTRSVAGR